MPAEPGILHVAAKSSDYKASCHGSQDCLGDITSDSKHWFTKSNSVMTKKPRDIYEGEIKTVTKAA